MLVRFFETVPTALERVGAGGVLHFRPIGDWTLAGDPDEHINSRPFTRTVGATGRVDQELAATGAERAWQVEYTGNPGWGPVYVQVLGAAGEPVDWPELVRVDPATLEPTAEPEAAWWAAWAAMAVDQITLSGPLVLTIPAGFPAGQVYRCAITQDGTGGHTVTYGGAPVTVDTAVGASTLVEVWPGGTLVYPGASAPTGAPATRGLIITDADVPTIPAGSTVDNLAAYYNSGASAITVAGVELAAGSHAVWAWVSGAWVLLASGTTGGGEPPTEGPTTVTPTAPTANDTDATVGTLAANSYRIPASTGVDYKVGGVTKAAGDYSVGNSTTSVTVTAFAQTGYVVSGTDSWTFNFTASATWVTLAHDTFAGVDGSQWHGRVLDQTPDYAWNRTDASAAAMIISANRLQYNPGGVNLGVSGVLNPAPTTPTSPSGVRITLTYSGVVRFSVDVGYTSSAYGVQVGVYNLGVNLSASFTGVDATAAALTAASGQSLAGGPSSGTQVVEIIGTTVRIYQDGTLRATGALPGALREQAGKMSLSGGGTGNNYVDSYKLEVMS